MTPRTMDTPAVAPALPQPPRALEPPLRSELLSLERSVDAARLLAAAQDVSFAPSAGPTPLHKLLSIADSQIHEAIAALAAEVRAKRAVSPATEWLLDNSYLIDEQIREAGSNLPSAFGRELPHLKSGPYVGFPRVYELAALLVENTDSRLEGDYLEQATAAFQETAPLNTGELWAVPIMLRIALVENVRRLSRRVLAAHVDEIGADDWADALTAAAGIDDEGTAANRLATQLTGDSTSPSMGFLVRLEQRLQGQDVAVATVHEWAARHLRESGAGSLETAATELNRIHAADQVSIASAITSMRLLSALDWKTFFESVSVVEAILRHDPVGTYGDLDFATRDRYRHAVEGLARRCPRSESETAEMVVAAAAEALAADPSDTAGGHVGYYLISRGRYGFEKALGYRPTLRETIFRGPLRHAGRWYFGSLAVILLALVAAVIGHLVTSGTSAWAVVVIGLLAVVPLSDVALGIVNRTSNAIWAPVPMPKLNPELPVAPEHRTLVVIPALLTSAAETEEVVANLEIHFLANTDPGIHYALLGDLKGGAAQFTEGDGVILDTAVNAIRMLNDRYGSEDGRGPFHLLVRERTFNQIEQVWMGRERKRGALEDLVGLVSGEPDASFRVLLGDGDFLDGVAFVLTLDSDTVLPRDGARKLVATIAHPLNRAHVDADRRVVRRGYGLIQPRVAMSLPAASKSGYARLFSGVTGVDPYGGASSDVYMDAFGEGSFTGKGIFDVGVYRAILEGRFPDDTLLSHDLIEGSYLRTGFASDIEVFDDHPATYPGQVARLHRWIRGDWQVARWLLPTVPTATGNERNALTGVQRWKIFDNLRRSVLPATMVLLLAFGLALVPNGGWIWPVGLALIVFFPAYLHLFDSLAMHPRGVTVRSSVSTLFGDLGRDSMRALFGLALMPHAAWTDVDAAARAIWRSAFSKRSMLEWTTAAEAEGAYAAGSLADYIRRIGPSAAVGVVLLVPSVVLAPNYLPATLLLAIVWLAGPELAHRLSRPLRRTPLAPSAEDRVFVRRTARKTWRFFETFLTAEDRWLAPDNFQEDPKGEIAHRTSPTNIGLQLVSYLAARDMGYETLPGLVGRTTQTLQTMAGLERFRGHFYNWYDTRTLQPLPPSYVSTVDSGNLAGYLLVLRIGLLEASEAPFVSPVVLDGLVDTVRLALEDLGEHDTLMGDPHATADLRRALGELERRADLAEPAHSAAGWCSLFEELDRLAEPIAAELEALEAPTGDAVAATPLRASLEAVTRLISENRNALDRLAPWARIAEQAPAIVRHEPYADALAPIFQYVPSLVGMAEGMIQVHAALDALASDTVGDDADTRLEVAAWATRMRDALAGVRPEAAELLATLRLMADIAREMWEHTDFGMLYDPTRGLFSIGYNTAEARLDASFYDLLASECRLASFLAIAKDDVPQSHWFRLGRTLAATDSGYVLISWSASMFEYLMPLLVMHSYPATLMADTYESVVRRQEQYGKERGVPWGVSESAFNAKDSELTYQYQAFGVPGLGLKRGLSEDLVIAPYASALALMVDVPRAVANLKVLASQGAEGRFGFYESVDYTPGRVPAGAQRAVVRAYFAHHQGMAFAAASNVLSGFAMQRRFHEDPIVRSADLLLQESVPRHVPVSEPHVDEVEFVRVRREPPPPVQRSYPTAATPVPATHFLSNGSYSVMVTNAGAGYSRWHELAVTRYREDITRDCWGQFVYVRDVGEDRCFSAGFQPTLAEADEYHVTFSADKAEFRRRDGDLETYTEIAVSPEDDAETRRVTVTNHGRKPRTVEVTSYFEVAMSPQAGDQAHRTFSNLFVETESDAQRRAVFFSRRPRSAHEKRVWGFHVLGCDPGDECTFECETDRARFVGRLRTPIAPLAMSDSEPLSGTVGAVLDPVCSLRRTVTIPAGGSARVSFATGVAETREAADALVDKYGDVRSAQRTLDLAWTSSQIELHDLGLSPEEAVVFERLSSRLLLTDPFSPLKAIPEEENRLPVATLWQLGISGDLPILLLRIDRLEDTPLVRQMLLAHQYWRHKGLRVDLVIVNTRPSAYFEELDEKLRLLVRTGHALQLLDKPGGVFLRRADQMAPDVWLLMRTLARVTLFGDRGSVASQLNRRGARPESAEPFVAKREIQPWPARDFQRPELLFDNGIGGFDPDTDEYVIVLEGDQNTPAPWVNVMANPTFGSVVSEAGIGCTWALNSHENRLTTWNNDPVSDGSGEAVYLRDEETGEVWSPTPLPVRNREPYIVRHGFGVTTFEHAGNGLTSELTYFVDPEDPVRIARLRLTNDGDRKRTLSAIQFVEWSLGDSRSRSQQRVVTRYDAEERMLTAHNWYNLDFPGRVAFLTTNRDIDSYTASRTEFLGRNGHPGDPAALHDRHLGGLTGRFHDPCGALLTRLTLEPGETTEVVWVLGQADTLEDAREIAARHRRSGPAAATLERAKTHWQRLLGTIQVKTPDTKLDMLLNGWLLYQTISCRIWGRTAFYQSSGAFGFRDQLQDMLSLLPVRPDLARAQLLEASRRQFREGDALHWWQPYSGRGVRTHYTDDRVWLPYVAARYVTATGDTGVLDEYTPFINGPLLPLDQEDAYLVPTPTEEHASLYEHCLRALRVSMRVGEHGIPLMGGGDWNDGMNRVGHLGRGESIWLGWFLVTTCRSFAELSETRGDADAAAELRAFAERVAVAIEENGWDGAWYRRAYFDDGTPLGTRSAEECRIDAIAQAWSVISGAADPDRSARAMDAVEEHLVRWEDGLVALLDPPFDTTELDPGYIKGYVPGVRENGGQYTHAAVWVALAHLAAGDGDEALALLDLINPITRSCGEAGCEVYRVEPYVLAADVYGSPPHVGRGGWTWYTGSASWYYAVATQDALGIKTVGGDGGRFLAIDPCIPKAWPGFEAQYRIGDTRWEITVANPRGVNRGVERVEVDGVVVADGLVALIEDGNVHTVIVTMLGG